MARALTTKRNLPHVYWAKAVNTVVYFMKRFPIVAIHNVTLEEKYTRKKPYLSHMKVFGCIAYVHVPDELRTKLDSKAKNVCSLIIILSKRDTNATTLSHVMFERVEM